MSKNRHYDNKEGQNLRSYKKGERQKIKNVIERARKIRKWGNTHTIILQKADLSDLKLQQGDFVDINKLRRVE